MSEAAPRLPEAVEKFAATFAQLQAEIAKVIVGQTGVVEGALAALFAGGHVLLEGLPGLGKTILVKTLAECVELAFKRIQFTPDLMPADIVGTTVLRENEAGRRVFEFQRGPVFGHVLLADEINRATPKTQSALLEAMQEASVTAGGVTHVLEPPFFVLATQNPIELEGTYALPEAQIDRFLLKLLVTWSDARELVTILSRTTGSETARPARVLDRAGVLAARELVRQVPAATPVQEYAARLTLATHPANSLATPLVKSYVRFGASPRGAQSILLCGKVRALTQRRFHAACEDVRAYFKPALRHRLILNIDGETSGVTTDQILDEVLQRTAE